MEQKVTVTNKKYLLGALFWKLAVSIIAVLVIGAGVFTILTKFRYSHSPKLHTRPTNIVHKYASALELSLLFFDAQKSGKLQNNRVSWRGDSGLRDGSEANLDLSKGMYDAGDLMKFGFPMAFTATVLSWAILEYGDHMDEVNQLQFALDSLKWVTDYLVNAHPFADVLYIQVGDPEVDHNCWERPEDMTEGRPLTQVNSSFPGTEVAAETAAALASASLVFKDINVTYSDILLGHAQQLFTFADTYKVSYSVSVPQVGQYYNSSGYWDELLWAGSWLYHATNDPTYLNYVTQQNENAYGNLGSLSWFSWDDKHAATQVLLSRVNFFGSRGMPDAQNLDLQKYRESAEMLMCKLLPDSPTATTNRTESGLIWVVPWNPLQHSVASAFLAVLYSDYMLTSQTENLYCSGKLYKPVDLRKFAISQAEYVLGENPMRMSYLVGYGSDYPKHIHHRGSSIPVNATTGCRDGFKKWFDSPHPNPNTAVGALVGGPFFNETYNDFRNNSMQGEPTTYSSALLVALLSGLVASSSVDRSF
ncbi:endoglucanase 2-like [Lotus japonicus]|uniref:endoglucanase 2-like n=1 Tax=Lotus japonicus TaxID=34305 RepID=UPI002587821D|nr:endoglucanase 2-like [Lotus japonicus]